MIKAENCEEVSTEHGDVASDKEGSPQHGTARVLSTQPALAPLPPCFNRAVSLHLGKRKHRSSFHKNGAARARVSDVPGTVAIFLL